MSDAEWFSGDPPRTDSDAAFLTRLREEAAQWNIPDLTPGATRSHAAASLIPSC